MTGNHRRLGVVAAIALLAAWVFLPFVPFSIVGNANLALSHALVAISLVVLTGWVGQISLAQASFVGIGAVATGLVVRAWGLPFPVTMLVAGGVAAAMATLLGLVALRVRGLYLAVATLIFAWMCDAYLFVQPWAGVVGGSSAIPNVEVGRPGTIPNLDFTSRKVSYLILLALVTGAVLAAANIRDSKTGRAWFAVRGSEVAAASLGVSVIRYKLLAFTVSGFLAGAAGNVIMTRTLVVTPASFTFEVSLLYLAIAVVGGLRSLGGAVAAGVLFAALEQAFFEIEALAGLLEVVSAALLAVVLLFFPAGLSGIPSRARPYLVAAWRRIKPLLQSRYERAFDRAARDAAPDTLSAEETRPPEPDEPASNQDRPALEYEPGTANRADLPPRDRLEPELAARNVTVRFGGLTAVDDATLEVRRGEIVGLIGPNGAGKTTLFNAISGLNEPNSGTIELFGRDVTGLPVHDRADLGLGRTFQVIQLFPQLTVFDNLLVATHAHNPSGFLSHLLVTERAVNEERAARDRTRRVIRLLGLEEVAEREVTGLPFGVLRLVEVGRSLVTGAPFVMLDEPASGLDERETDGLMDLLLWIRERLGISILLIEHDVRMVTGISDHMYVIDQGRIIAEGTPSDVQSDPEVIAAYLGDTTSLGEVREPTGARA